MRPGIDATWLAALQAQGITTNYLVRLDFLSETIFVWTGYHAIMPTGSGDTLLDNNEFLPFEQGVATQVGENSFSTSGSEAFELVLAVPASMPEVMEAASLSPAEYLSRPATIWRSVMIEPAGVGTPAQWVFRRIRAGKMDNLEIQHNADGSTFKLSVEAYAAAATAATASSYIDQKRFDATDTSQDWASSAQNGEPGKHHETPFWQHLRGVTLTQQEMNTLYRR